MEGEESMEERRRGGRCWRNEESWRAEVAASSGTAPRRAALVCLLSRDQYSRANSKACRGTGRPLHDDLIASLMGREPAPPNDYYLILPFVLTRS